MGTDSGSIEHEPSGSDQAAQHTRVAVYVLYRLFSRSGDLLYVGVTKNVNSRLADHAAKQPWWTQVHHSKTKLEWFSGAGEVAEAEHKAIADESPVYNVAGRPGKAAQLYVEKSRIRGPRAPRVERTPEQLIESSLSSLRHHTQWLQWGRDDIRTATAGQIRAMTEALSRGVDLADLLSIVSDEDRERLAHQFQRAEAQ